MNMSRLCAEANPCPFCGGDLIDLIPMDFEGCEIDERMAIEYDISYEYIEGNHRRFCEELEKGSYISTFALSCKTCTATVLGDTVNDTIAKWNKRATTDDIESEIGEAFRLIRERGLERAYKWFEVADANLRLATTPEEECKDE